MELKFILAAVAWLVCGAALYGLTLEDGDRVQPGILLSYLGLWPFVLVAVFVAATARVIGATRRKK